MGMKAGSGKGFRAEINVTPLVDVVLVLLIIFMVVTPMLQKGKAVDLPPAKHVLPGKSPHDQLVVVVTAEKKVWAGETEIRMEEVEDTVRRKLPFNPGLELVVKGDESLDYGTVRDVMTACRRAGAKRVVLATRELKETP